ncbi:MAG: zf-HC2 domain-containing protein [Candidatus Aminicenantes bacterium]|nr:zf-HC2 domain-containing protein [Candidatus Aminicenantes bacterium]
MECKKVEDLLSAYIENDLPKEVRKEITQHLEHCRNCKLLKEEMEELIYRFPALEEDVPFFLKNRLLYIPESQEEEEEIKNQYLKWVAAVIGTIVLFLNIFYFTDIYPPANRALHAVVSQVEIMVVETGAFFEKVKESGDRFIYASTPKKADEKNKTGKDDTMENNGGKNG